MVIFNWHYTQRMVCFMFYQYKEYMAPYGQWAAAH